MKWFIVVIEELGFPDSWIWNPFKIQAENEEEAVNKVRDDVFVCLTIDSSKKEKEWKERFEVINIYDCGSVEPIDLLEIKK